MVSNSDKVRIIFGLKIRQLRLEKALSLAEVAVKVGFSVSYLNEIEKGKKYPKSDKIMALASFFQIDYDELVSLKLVNDLEPIADILNSTVLNDLPLEMFGIEASDFVDLMSKSPTKISAFINTLKEISRSYDIQNEEFFEAVLRSYQEMNENYFEDIEGVVENFRVAHSIGKTQIIEKDFLKKILFENYNYSISGFESNQYPKLTDIDLIWKEPSKIAINNQLPEEEITFLLAKEIGYQVLGLKGRPNSNPIVKVVSFEAIFNNFKAAYFARALLINKDILVGRLTYFLASPKWDSDAFLAIMSLFNTPPYVFIDRVTNLLSGHFGLNNLFLLGMKHDSISNKFHAVNEMHLRQLHSPHGYARKEHYCRRWLGLSIMTDLDAKPFICDSQISEFSDSNRKYFVISVAYYLRSGEKRSDTIGFVLDSKLKSVLNFVGDGSIKKRVVNQTCERCGMKDCKERAAEPIVYNLKMEKLSVLEAVSKLKF
ncbi:MAG: helix-turn-helix transcriptional regulator [Bacteroidota bacterium]